MKLSFQLGVQAVMLAAALQGLALAQGPISAVQEALRREELLFGEPSGVFDEKTREALRRYQTRRGFPATGELDAATLKALQGPMPGDPPPIESVRPGVPAPSAKVSDSVLERDREFLRTLEASEAAREQHMPPPAPVAERVTEPAAPEAMRPQALPTPEPAPPSRRAAFAPAAPAEQLEPVPGDPWNSRQLEPLAKPKKSQRKSPAQPLQRSRIQIVESEDYQDPIEPGGVRIIRSTGTDRSGRTVIYETRTYAEKSAPVLRRAVPVEPRRKAGLFDRIFNGNDDDDDDD